MRMSSVLAEAKTPEDDAVQAESSQVNARARATDDEAPTSSSSLLGEVAEDTCGEHAHAEETVAKTKSEGRAIVDRASPVLAPVSPREEQAAELAATTDEAATAPDHGADTCAGASRAAGAGVPGGDAMTAGGGSSPAKAQSALGSGAPVAEKRSVVTTPHSPRGEITESDAVFEGDGGSRDRRQTETSSSSLSQGKPVAAPSAAASPDTVERLPATAKSKRRGTFGLSLFGRRGVDDDEKAGDEVEEAPEVTSDLCALLVKDLDSIFQDKAAKSNLKKTAQEALVKAQDAAREKRLLSCAALLKAGVQASELKHKTISIKGLVLLQRLALHHCIQPLYFPAVAKALRACADSWPHPTSEELQVKVLQVCAAAAESEHLICTLGPSLSIVETVLIVMGGPFDGAAMAAEATLHQIVKAIFDFLEIRATRVERRGWASGAALKSEEDALAGAAHVAAQVVREIVLLCDKKGSKRLRYRKPNRGVMVALDIIHDMLRTRAPILSSTPDLTAVLTDVVCPFLLEQVQCIGAGALRLLPREAQSEYAPRVSVAVQYMNVAAAFVSGFPQPWQKPHEREPAPTDAEKKVLAGVANMLHVLTTMAREAKPSWVRLLALEVMHEFCMGPALHYRARAIFMLCRSYEEWEDKEIGSSANVLVTFITTLEGLIVKLLDVPGSDTRDDGSNVLVSQQLTDGMHRRESSLFSQKGKSQSAPLLTLSKSLLLAPSEADARRWTRGLEALRHGDLAALGAAMDAELAPGVTKDGRSPRAILVESVRAELSLACCVLVMEAFGTMCGVLNWRAHACLRVDTEMSVASTTAAASRSESSIGSVGNANGEGAKFPAVEPSMDAELMMANAEASWHMMDLFAPSLLNISRVAFKFVAVEPVLRAVLRAQTTFTQVAAILQIVPVRNMALNCLCRQADVTYLQPESQIQDRLFPMDSMNFDRRRLLVIQELIGVILELSTVLHDGWGTVLPSLQRMRFALMCHIRKQNAQVHLAVSLPTGGASAADVLPPDVQGMSSTEPTLVGGRDANASAASLLASLNAIFASSWCLPDTALVVLLEELSRLTPNPAPFTAENIDAGEPRVPVPDGSVSERCFAIDQTLVVLRHNLFRVHVLWPSTCSHLSQVLSRESASERDYGLKCFTEICREILIFLGSASATSASAAMFTDGPLPHDAALRAKTERQVMAAFQEMYTRSVCLDTKLAVVKSLHFLLSEHEDNAFSLSTGWRPLLQFLTMASQRAQPGQMVEVKACLDLICKSMLSQVPEEDLDGLVQCLEAMGLQDSCEISAVGTTALLLHLATFLSSNDPSPASRPVGVIQSSEWQTLAPILDNVLLSLLTLGQDSRVPVRGEALQGLFSLLSRNAHYKRLQRSMFTCRHHLLPFLDAVAQVFVVLCASSLHRIPCRAKIMRMLYSQQVEATEEVGSQCWQHWLATWLTVVQGTAMILETGLIQNPAVVQGSQELQDIDDTLLTSHEEARAQAQTDGLAAWEGLVMRLDVALTCDNSFVIRAALRALTKPFMRAAGSMPRAAWDTIWDCLPNILHTSMQRCEASAEQKGRGIKPRLRSLPGPVLASLVVEELLSLCADPNVRRSSSTLAGERSLVSARNLSSLIDIVAAATRDFRFTGAQEPWWVDSGDEDKQGETRQQQAMRLYQVLVRAACDRADEEQAVKLWEQVIWALLRHLPWQGCNDSWWCADLAPPESAQTLGKELRCVHMSAQVLASLLLNDAPVYILRRVLCPVAMAMLAVMCNRCTEFDVEEWRSVPQPLLVVLKASVRWLRDDREEASDVSSDGELARRSFARRLTGGFQAFLIPTPQDDAPSVNPGKKGRGKRAEREHRVKDTDMADIETSMVHALVHDVIPYVHETEVCTDLLQLLDSLVGAAVSAEVAGRKDDLARNCLEGLLSLASSRGRPGDVYMDASAGTPQKSELELSASDLAFASLAALVAMRRCRALVDAFVDLELALQNDLQGQSGPSPLPPSPGGALGVVPRRRSFLHGTSAVLAVTALHGLEMLHLHPSSIEFLIQHLDTGKDSDTQKEARRRECSRILAENQEAKHRGHLILIFPTLVNCLVTDNLLVRMSARNMLQAVGAFIGIGTYCFTSKPCTPDPVLVSIDKNQGMAEKESDSDEMEDVVQGPDQILGANDNADEDERNIALASHDLCSWITMVDDSMTEAVAVAVNEGEPATDAKEGSLAEMRQ